jgi:hypothetical protein
MGEMVVVCYYRCVFAVCVTDVAYTAVCMYRVCIYVFDVDT